MSDSWNPKKIYYYSISRKWMFLIDALSLLLLYYGLLWRVSLFMLELCSAWIILSFSSLEFKSTFCGVLEMRTCSMHTYTLRKKYVEILSWNVINPCQQTKVNAHALKILHRDKPKKGPFENVEREFRILTIVLSKLQWIMYDIRCNILKKNDMFVCVSYQFSSRW